MSRRKSENEDISSEETDAERVLREQIESDAQIAADKQVQSRDIRIARESAQETRRLEAISADETAEVSPEEFNRRYLIAQGTSTQEDVVSATPEPPLGE